MHYLEVTCLLIYQTLTTKSDLHVYKQLLA